MVEAMAERYVNVGQIARAYVSLTKPRIIVLLLIVTLATMLVAAQGWPATSVVVFTMIGGALAAGGANALNCYIDRDIDELMSRTRSRPLPARRVDPQHALIFGLGLGVVSFLLFTAFVNFLAAVISLSALIFYVTIYTLWLKRTTPQNIVIGGAAGAAPPIVGWVAVTGNVEITPLILFAIIFIWTPPHFWALALLLQNDYKRAGVPMLPVVAGEQETRRQILLYSLALVASTLVLVPANDMGWLYRVASVVLGGAFLALAVKLYRDKTLRSARHLYIYSIFYLALLFGAMVIDKIFT
jgi:protoheme IX farnesyltransferase